MSFMAKHQPSYEDAVKLLGGDNGWTGLLSKLPVAALSAVPGVGTALSFLDLDDDLRGVIQKAMSALRNKLTGLSRFKRTELLEAAHTIIVVSAFCTAVRESRTNMGMTLDLARTDLIPDPDEDLEDYYSALAASLGINMPERALAIYEETLAKLAGEFPEFAFWAHRVGMRKLHQAADKLLALAADGGTPGKVRADLGTRYRYEVSQPIADTAATAADGGVTLPALRELYVSPSYRELPHSPHVTGVTWSDSAWDMMAPYDDLSARLAEHLLSTEATRAPLVLFGQPGAGKSATTQMLAAALDPRDFLVVRVELRTVHADATVQQQIEEALTRLTGRSVSWPEMADIAGGAQPVIMLDGFDELLQASAQFHHNYLEQVRDFQDREASLGRPIAVLVTSRTAVANQVRYPADTVMIRLEEFNDDQVANWLATWNRFNVGSPLLAEAALRHEELARQPLLLLMLALFRAEGGDLTPGLGQAQLYERLFITLAERDVAKLHDQISDADRRREAEQELDQLSLVAFAMFNRRAEWVTGDELAQDLAALRRAGDSRDGRTLVARLAGRFFFRLFVQRDQALQGQHEAVSRYEFLHATFGEFLVARWVVRRLRRLAARIQDLDDDIPDDALFRTLLSWAVLSTREQRVLARLTDLFTEVTDDEFDALNELLDILARDCLLQPPADPYPSYRPTSKDIPAGYAAYSANLSLLRHALLTDSSGSGPGLNVEGEPARLWHAVLSGTEWLSLVNVFKPSARVEPHVVVQPDWMRKRDWIDSDSDFGYALREAALLNIDGYLSLGETIAPYQHALGAYWPPGRSRLGNDAALLLDGLVSPAWDMNAGTRADLYRWLLGSPLGPKPARMLLSRLRDDMASLYPAVRTDLADTATQYAWANINAFLDFHHDPPEALLHLRPDDDDRSIAADTRDLIWQLWGDPSCSWLPGWLGELPRLSLPNLLMFTDLTGPPRWPAKPLDYTSKLTDLVEIALWAGLVQRGFNQDIPGHPLNEEDAWFARTIVPGFVDRVGRLAAERGYPDPFGSAGPHDRHR
jgi:NACHT conflict system protein/AAA domain-containing protein